MSSNGDGRTIGNVYAKALAIYAKHLKRSISRKSYLYLDLEDAVLIQLFDFNTKKYNIHGVMYWICLFSDIYVCRNLVMYLSISNVRLTGEVLPGHPCEAAAQESAKGHRGNVVAGQRARLATRLRDQPELGNTATTPSKRPAIQRMCHSFLKPLNRPLIITQSL